MLKEGKTTNLVGLDGVNDRLELGLAQGALGFNLKSVKFNKKI